MTKEDLKFTPHSDMTLQDIETVISHSNLIDNGKFSDATTLLNNNGYEKGFRASLFNSIQNKLREIQIYLLNKTAKPDEFYSVEEPSETDMEGKSFWIQVY